MSTKSARVRPPTWRSFLVIVSTTIAICVYLFVQAPPPLAAQTIEAGTVPMRSVFSMLELENDAARALWTEEIVDRGKAVGLAFDERWREETVHAGPLPALFLRETARNLERTQLQLSLFLGSPYPINTANQLTADQAAHFTALTEGGAPQFFFEPTTGRHTAMFVDRAVVASCVTCHNEHADSPKTDWKLHDIMGATTWMYPHEAVTTERALELVGAFRASIRAAYAAYLEKAAAFPKPPVVGDKWPKDGYFVPSEDVFMAELARRTSTTTLRALLEPRFAEIAAASEPVPDALPAPVRAPELASTSARPRRDVLTIRASRSTRVTVERDGSRLLVARIPAGGSTTLTARPPLQIHVSEPAEVEIEYDGQEIAVESENIVIGDGELSRGKS